MDGVVRKERVMGMVAMASERVRSGAPDAPTPPLRPRVLPGPESPGSSPVEAWRVELDPSGPVSPGRPATGLLAGAEAHVPRPGGSASELAAPDPHRNHRLGNEPRGGRHQRLRPLGHGLVAESDHGGRRGEEGLLRPRTGGRSVRTAEAWRAR